MKLILLHHYQLSIINSPLLTRPSDKIIPLLNYDYVTILMMNCSGMHSLLLNTEYPGMSMF